MRTLVTVFRVDMYLLEWEGDQFWVVSKMFLNFGQFVICNKHLQTGLQTHIKYILKHKMR